MEGYSEYNIIYRSVMADERETQALTETHKDRLQQYHEHIVEVLSDAAEEVVGYLRTTHSIDEDSAQTVLGRDTGRDSIRCLIGVLLRHSEKTYHEFLNAIYDQQTKESHLLYNALKDENTVPTSKRILYGKAAMYHTELQEFHTRNLERGIPLNVDLKTYIKLTLYPRQLKLTMLRDIRRGHREHGLSLVRTQGNPIEPQQLFKATNKEDTDKRCVLLIGAPGVGKTMTAFHFLQEHMQGHLWSQDFHFVILVLFREVNLFRTCVSFQNLLFNHFGPSVSDDEHKAKVWRYIEKKQDSVLFILDGYDECMGLSVNYDQSLTVRYSDTQKETKIQNLLYNLIVGNILPNARVLLTSRPHCVDQLEHKVSRTVELGGLDEKDLKMLIHTKLGHKPILAASLVTFLHNNPAIAGLCSSPVNAQGLLDYVLCRELEEEDREITSDLPKTRAALLFLLTLNLLQQHDRTREDTQNLTVVEILGHHRELLQNLASLAYSGLFEGHFVKQVFHDKDLDNHGLTKERVIRSGLMTGHVSVLVDLFKKVNQTMLSFPHLTFQEHLASLKTYKDKFDELLSEVKTNNGERDVVILQTIGLLSDPMCEYLLPVLNPNHDAQHCAERCERLLTSIWSSPRRCRNDGSLFCITSLAESLQCAQLSGHLMKYLVTPLNTLYLWDTIVSSADCSPLAEFLQNIPTPIGEIVVSATEDLHGFECVLNARGSKGLTIIAPRYAEESLEMLGRTVSGQHTLEYLMIRGNRENPCSLQSWSKFEVTENCNLRALGLLWGLIDSDETLCVLYKKLQKLPLLEALYIQSISCRRMSSEGSLIKPLAEFSSLKYLRLDKCELGPKDIPFIVEILCTKRVPIEWLDLSNNPLMDEGVAHLANNLTKTNLKGLRLSGVQVKSNGIKEIGQSLRENKTMTMLSVSFGTCSGCIGSLADAISKGSILTDLSLYKCKLNEQDMLQMVKALQQNTCLKYFSISGDQMYLSVMSKLADCLGINSTLQALCLREVGLSDNLLDKITTAVIESTTLQLLDLSENMHMTSAPISKIVEQSRIEHLAVSDCQFGAEGWSQIAMALIKNSHLIQCVVGDAGKEHDLQPFLNTMCSYPHVGPLQHLMVYGDKEHLATHMCKLQNTLLGQCTVNFVTFGLPFFVLSDLCNRDLPRDMRMWLLAAHTAIK